MNSLKLLIVILAIFLFVGFMSSSFSKYTNIINKNTPVTELHTYNQRENHVAYEYNSIYNRSELLQYEKSYGVIDNADTLTGKSGEIKNDSVDKKQAEDLFKGNLANGPMDSAWPMTSHDLHHTGRSPYNTTMNPDDIEKWRYNCDEYAQSGPIIDKNGTIYFGSFNGHLYAFYPNGTMKWATGIGTMDSTPSLDGNGIIYIGTIWEMPNYLYALYSNNGTVKWRYITGNHVDSSPVIGNDGTIYFGDWNGWIHALNPNGTLKWKYQTGNIVTGSPAIGLDGTVYCGSHDNKLYAFYPENGTVKWTFQTGDWVRVSPCIGDDGTVYCVSLDSYLYAIYPENGTMKWRVSVGAGTNPTVGRDGTIYAGYSYLCAVRPNGTMKWIFNPGPGSSIEGSTPCTSAEGIIYFGMATGAGIIAMNPDGTERWRDNYGWYESPPAIGNDGSIYIGCNVGSGTPSGCFRAFGSGKPTKIEIQTPQPGKFYLFNHDLGKTSSGNIIVIGSVVIKVNVSSPEEIQSVDFYVGYWITGGWPVKLNYSDTTPPYEWNLNKYVGNYLHWNLHLPFDYCYITVVGRYKNGVESIASIPKFWYFHLLKNV
jgi:outer membrane protein assembly factor BamB